MKISWAEEEKTSNRKFTTHTKEEVKNEEIYMKINSGGGSFVVMPNNKSIIFFFV
jgi:ATP-dependent protease ClpP protease subunit